MLLAPTAQLSSSSRFCCGVAVAFALLSGRLLAADPCGDQIWIERRSLLWSAVGDGRLPDDRVDELRKTNDVLWQPSSCIMGAACMHLLQIIRQERQVQVKELSVSGRDLMTVFLESSWLNVGTQGWPFFGLLHLLQWQLASSNAKAAHTSDTVNSISAMPSSSHEEQAAWQAIVTDDHMRFRNWIYSHLVHGQAPPLVDSIHFLARADPREPDEKRPVCSVAKSMGYLATALVFAQEADAGTRDEAKKLVHSAERHVKECYLEDPTSFTFRALLETKWPIWWLLHSVLMYLDPLKAGLHWQSLQAYPTDSVSDAPAAKGQKIQDSLSVCSQDGPNDGAPVLQTLPANVAAAFHDLGSGIYMADVKLLEKVSKEQPISFVQLFKNGVPVRKVSKMEGIHASSPPDAHMAPMWMETNMWDRKYISLYDPDFASASSAYALSFAAPSVVGLYLEPGSAGDPYNAEWLQAFQTAFARMNLLYHEISKASDAYVGVTYFWRINQMFAGGHLAGAPGVGLAIAQHLKELSSQGVALFPRPSAMRFYQDKIALHALFDAVGVPTPKTWVVASMAEFAELTQSGQISEQSFPLVLKHPFAASSRGMKACKSMSEVLVILGDWLAEHKVPCLLQQRLMIARDLRLTYIGGKIVHGYWRLKSSSDVLTSGTGIGGSKLDFNIPHEQLASFVWDFAQRTGIEIGGMDIAFPEGQGPVVFEVSPIFDLNPEPPVEWADQPYKEYKETEDYRLRRAENYAACAQKIVEYALGHRGLLAVDIDNTVNDAWNRIQRATLPSWPGETFNAKQAFSNDELSRDHPLPAASQTLTELARDWEIVFLSARGSPCAYIPTVQWLREHGFRYSRVVLVAEARDKIAWLKDWSVEASRYTDSGTRYVLLVDDLLRNHHKAMPEPNWELINSLKVNGIRYEVFDHSAMPWPQFKHRIDKHSESFVKSGGALRSV